MSVKKLIFKAIESHLMARLNTETNLNYPTDLPALKWFDKQMGQFTDAETSYALPLPTVLIEFGQFTWTTTGLNTQKGEGVLRFYTYFENYANSFSGSLNQELALQFFEFTEQVNIYLQGLTIAGILSALERITDAEDVEQDMIITSILEYSCTIYDNSTNVTRNNIEIDPDVTVIKAPPKAKPEDKTFLTA